MTDFGVAYEPVCFDCKLRRDEGDGYVCAANTADECPYRWGLDDALEADDA